MKNHGGKYIVSDRAPIFKNLSYADKMDLYDSMPREFRDVLKSHVINVTPTSVNASSIEETKREFQKLDADKLMNYKKNITEKVRMSSKKTYGEDYPYEWSPW